MSESASPLFSRNVMRAVQPVFGLLMITILFSFLSNVFFNNAFNSTQTVLNLFEQSSVLLILAAGMTLVLIAGGIDLSIGSVLALCGVVAGRLLGADVPVWLVFPAVLLVGGVCGAVNGFTIVLIKVPPFIVTLGMLMAASGLAALIGVGHSMTDFPKGFNVLGAGYTVPISISLVVTLAIAFVLARTKFGFNCYAIGGNEEVARLSGVNVGRYKIATYIIMGVLTGLASMVYTAKLGVALPGAGVALELEAIAAVVIGGTSLMGGVGGVMRTLIGVLIVMLLKQGLAAVELDSNYQKIVVGGIVVVAVIIDQIQRSNANRVKKASPLGKVSLALGVLMFGGMLATVVVNTLAGGAGENSTGNRVAFIGYNATTPYWVTMKNAAQDEAEKLGLDFRDMTQARADANDQKQAIDNAIKNGFDGLIIGAVDSRAMEDSLNRAQEAGVKVVVVDQKIDHPVISSSIATDNLNAARLAGQYIREKLGGQGKLLMLGGTAGNETAEMRLRGVHEKLEGSGVQTIVRVADWQPDKANQFTTAELAVHGDINAIYAACDPMIIAAYKVAEQQGKENQILMVGFDAIDDCLKLIHKGQVDATIRQDPPTIARTAVRNLAKVLDGETVPASIPIDAQIITQDNISNYYQPDDTP